MPVAEDDPKPLRRCIHCIRRRHRRAETSSTAASLLSFLFVVLLLSITRTVAFVAPGHPRRTPICLFCPSTWCERKVKRRPHRCGAVLVDSASVEKRGVVGGVDGGARPLPIEATAVSSDRINVLYESDRILAINKPHGVPHHDGHDEIGILSTIRLLQKQGRDGDADGDVGGFPYGGRLYGVHRLDRETSGILLFAKDAATAGELSSSFRRGTVTKYYVALSDKKPRKKKQGWVKGDMVKGRRGSWKLTPTMVNPAVTRFYAAGLGGLSAAKRDGNDFPPRTVVLFRPLTGRTHQIRVAAKSLGLPILGDPRYGGGGGGKREESAGQGASDDAPPPPSSPPLRTYLHAAALRVKLDDGEDVVIWSPPPFAHLWEDGGGGGSGGGSGAEFSRIAVDLLKKHCDCEPLLKLLYERS